MTRPRIMRIVGIVLAVVLVAAALAVSFRVGYGRGLLASADGDFPFIRQYAGFEHDFDDEDFEPGRLPADHPDVGPDRFGHDFDRRDFGDRYDGFGYRSFGPAAIFFLAIPLLGMLLHGIFIGVVVAVTLNWIQRRQARKPIAEEELPVEEEPKAKTKRSSKKAE